MYYIKLSDTDNNKLTYYCRKCGSNDDTTSINNVCVSKININNNSQKIDLFVNNYTKLDPTLPRTKSIKCPNNNCDSNIESVDDIQKKEREILYIRYDDTNMKYIYVCCNCDFVLKTN